mmetsp:Transcript_12138/g.23136  ORF Transcript_12138/g.23136 Transcript_12138/m.23136 type:complete len:401 (-) Transcript_12138:211-1413(-)
MIVFPVANLILPLLLFDGAHHHHHYNQPQAHQFAHPSSSSIIVASVLDDGTPGGTISPDTATITNIHRYRDGGVIGNAESATTIIASSSSSSSSASGDHSSRYEWNLPNGKVQFERPLKFRGIKLLQDDGTSSSSSLLQTDSSSSATLWNPTFLGSGGSGAVFSFSTSPDNSDSQSPGSPSSKGTAMKMNGQQQTNNDEEVAIKVSWKRSRDSVENECRTLQNLQKNRVPHVEQCLGRPNNPYPYEDGRVMIALTPVISSSSTSSSSSNDGIISTTTTSDLTNVKSGQPRSNAVKSVVETMVGMLRVGIYTVDVQPLINAETGDTLFIDFTEAERFSIPPSAEEESGLVGFCSEMFVLIPDTSKEEAGEYLRAELENLSNGEEGHMSEKVLDILESIWVD